MQLRFQQGARRWTVIAAALTILLVLTACGGDDGENGGDAPDPSPTATVEPTSTPEPAPTETPTPEPTATPTMYVPAPTVAAPLYIPPPQMPDPTEVVEEPEPTPVNEEPEPTPVDPETEPPPDVEVPENTGEIGELLLGTDLRDIGGWEIDIGWSYPSEDGYHIVNVGSEGQEAWDITNAHLQFGNVVAMIDVRNIGESVDSVACFAVRTGPGGWDHAYALCLTNSGFSYGDFKYIDSDGVYRYEEIVEFAVREETLPPEEWNMLTIVANGQRIAFFVNEEMIGAVDHPAAEVGGIAFMVGNYDEVPAEWIFTNLEVWQIQ